MRSLRKLLGISKAELYLVAYAYLLLCRVRFGLWRLPFKKLYQKVRRDSQQPALYPFKGNPSLRQIIRSVNISSRLMPGRVRCLARALSVQTMASQFHYDLDLHIGVAKDNGQSLEAHAWVAYQNQVVLGAIPDLNRFVPILLIPCASNRTSSGVLE